MADQKTKKIDPILPDDIQRMIDEIEGVIPEEEVKPAPAPKAKAEEVHENMGKVADSLRIDDDDDFEDALDAIRSMNRYGEGSIDRFRYLYWIVYRAGFQDGQYDDQLFWDERGRLTETKLSVDDTGHLELIPKSLSPENESLIIRQFKEQWEKFRQDLRQPAEAPRKSRGMKF